MFLANISETFICMSPKTLILRCFFNVSMRQSNIYVTVDAVVIKPGRPNQVLLIKRKNDPFKGMWALPGGFVDEDEDLPDAACRELCEETGIQARPTRQIGAFGKPGRDPRHQTVSVAYRFDVPTDTIAKAADDASDAEWFEIDNLPDIAFDHADIISHSKIIDL
jgi:8-oxo-dGTP diphosphatase